MPQSVFRSSLQVVATNNTAMQEKSLMESEIQKLVHPRKVNNNLSLINHYLQYELMFSRSHLFRRLWPGEEHKCPKDE